MMADLLTVQRRSWNMSRIRSRDTGPELRLRSMLHRAGFRYRIHVGNLPGSPDIVLPRYRTVIFVHGCFWHRHSGCKNAATPSTRREFWQNKFEENVRRDERNASRLAADGWKVIVVWECELNEDARCVVDSIADALRGVS